MNATRKTDKTSLAVMANNIEHIRKDVEDIKKTLHADYVTRFEFEPIKRLVYGVVGLILVAVITALLSLVLSK